MIEYNPNLIYLIYDEDNSYKIFTGVSEYYWVRLENAKFDHDGCLILTKDLFPYDPKSIEGMQTEIEDILRRARGTTLHIFNNLKEARDILS